MVEAGRTMARAIADGTCYEIRNPAWGRYNPPAAESPAEVLACAQEGVDRGWFQRIPPGMVFAVNRIKGGAIGCRFVEECGTITA